MSLVLSFDIDCHLGPMKVGLGTRNPQLDSWIINQLEKDGKCKVVKKLEGVEDDLSELDAIILLRKTRTGGVENPLAIARKFSSIYPGAHVLFIVGPMDDEGKKLVRQLEQLDVKLLVASAQQGQMGAEELTKWLDELMEDWKECHTNVYLVKGAKGGCGCTTIAAHLANHLAEQGNVVVIESRDSLQYHHVKPGIELLQKSSITSGEIKELQKQYHYIILDNIHPEEVDKLPMKTICVLDSSIEALQRAKSIPADRYVLNHACSDIMPIQVAETELGKKINLIIECDRQAFIRASIDGTPAISGFESLV